MQFLLEPSILVLGQRHGARHQRGHYAAVLVRSADILLLNLIQNIRPALVFGFLFFLAYTLLKNSRRRTLLFFIFGGMVALIGWSRIYEGQHWASDVLAAYLLGSVWLTLSVFFYNWGKPRFFVKNIE